MVFIHAADENSRSPKATAAWKKLEGTSVHPLLLEFRDIVFRSDLPSVPPSRQVSMDASIEVSYSTPVHRKQFPLSREQKEAIMKWTREMLKAKLIQPSKSPYCAPTFCVRKASGEWRIVHDFRGLNAKIRVPANHIPRKDEILRTMSRGRIISALDLLWGKIPERLRTLHSIFNARWAIEYLVTPMDISSSPSCFNRLVQSISKDFVDFCCTYFDDLFIFTQSENVDGHLGAVTLRGSATVREDREMYILRFRDSVPCVDGVRIDPAKAATIRDWPTPSTKRELQSFIGTCVYVSRFCVGFAEHVAVLTELIKNKKPSDEITLLAEHQAAFESLKVKHSTTPTLAHADFTKSFRISVDASDFAIGGYLFQYDGSGREQIIAYGGRKLSRAELIYPTRKKELLAALHAMRTWKVYLIDKPFYLNTDHRTIESLLKQQTCSQRLARWLNELALFQPRFKWVPGSTNIIADCISRRPDWSDGTSRAISLSELLRQFTSPLTNSGEERQFVLESSPPVDVLAMCRANYHNDTIFGPIMKDLCQDTDSPSRRLRRFSIDDGLLFSEHDTPARGHPGQAKTLLLLLGKYYWRGMAESVQRYVSKCELSQRHKYIPFNRWTDISMDFMTQLPTTASGHDAVLVIVDRLTKRSHFIATHMDASAADIATLFRDFYQRLHGLPESSYPIVTQSSRRSSGGL
ncbi:Reverse transcriptase [Phytophthora palmivora]|uniref:Reverse transcriptase n=1 Tax=Phytophthora palmivora TaxID=4796 RepID=A0A2P4XVA0_9STRA|nr:Reverse transcriptase [Phytophthora palmivora]